MVVSVLNTVGLSLVWLSSLCQSTPVEVSISPAHPYLETGKTRRHLSFDFIVHNRSDKPLRISSVRVRVLDKASKLVLDKFTENGLSASLQSSATIPGVKKILLL